MVPLSIWRGQPAAIVCGDSVQVPSVQGRRLRVMQRRCRSSSNRAIRIPFGFVMSRRAANKAGRNPPQQSRSRATVSTILDATVRVLDREGADAATTTRIAEVAGVSVGTLYQYFGNRDSILDA